MRNDEISSLTRERARELRREMTPQEGVLWSALRSRRAGGIKFRRQHPVGPFILDFYCVEAALAVELDGSVHDDPIRRGADERRSRWLMEHEGIDVVRVTNMDVVVDVETVCDVIIATATSRIATRTLSSGRGQGEGVGNVLP